MARVGGAWGVRGWVKVKPYTDEPPALLRHRTWLLQRRPDEAWWPVEMIEGRVHADAIVARLAGVASREEAAGLAGSLVGIARDELAPLREGEVYEADLVGLAVVNRAGATLGRVVAVDAFGAHPVLRVAAGDRERLIPFVRACVDAVDVAGGRIAVDWETDY